MKKRNLSITSFFIGFMLFAGHVFADDLPTITYPTSTRGTTVTIPEDKIISYCGDGNGCELRLGMFNWDGTQRTASRSILFYYSPSTKNWKTSNDNEGTNYDANTQHIINAWSCYFTDGEYLNWTDYGDPNLNFGVLSWNQYNARCYLSIVD